MKRDSPSDASDSRSCASRVALNKQQSTSRSFRYSDYQYSVGRMASVSSTKNDLLFSRRRYLMTMTENVPYWSVCFSVKMCWLRRVKNLLFFVVYIRVTGILQTL